MQTVSYLFFDKLLEKQRKEITESKKYQMQRIAETVFFDYDPELGDYFYDVNHGFMKFEESGRAVKVTSEFEVARLMKHIRKNEIILPK